MTKRRGNDAKQKKTDRVLRGKRLAKNNAARYTHKRAKQLLCAYYDDPSDTNLEAVLFEFDKMIDAVLYKYGALKFNETPDYKQACRMRLWEILVNKKLDPEAPFGAYLNSVFRRAYRNEAQKLYKQSCRAIHSGPASMAYEWKTQYSANPETRAEAKEIIENAEDFCHEWVETFRFPLYKEVFHIVVEFFFGSGRVPTLKEVIWHHKRATAQDKMMARLIYTAAVVHFRIALQSALRGERLRREII